MTKCCLHCTNYPAWKNSSKDSSANTRGFCNLLHCEVSSDHHCNSFHNYKDQIYYFANEVAQGNMTSEEIFDKGYVPYHQREYFLEVVGHIEDELRWAHDEAVLEEARLHE